VVAQAAMKQGLALAAAAAAFLFLAVLAFHGERPKSGISELKPAGVMATTEPTLIREVLIGGSDGERRLARGTPEWQAADPAIEQGLRFLHVTAPQRVMTEDEVGATPAADFGLDPPALSVALHGEAGPVLAIAFGGPTPLGVARYARVAGRPGVVILPSYVAEAWEKVAASR
jgi:hypothetical protein